MNPLMQSLGKTPRKGTVKACPVCGKEFYCPPVAANKRICCSVACLAQYRSTKAAVDCQTCGQAFTKAKCYGAKFCSRKCYLKSRQPAKGCAVCGAQLTKQRMTYCGRECEQIGRRNGSEVECGICRKAFYAEAASGRKYCSRKCADASKKFNVQQGPGKKFTRSDGYISVYYPTHPDANKSRYVLEHRLVAEEKYGRRIRKDEHVHHIDGDRQNNHPDNLEVVSPSAHSVITSREAVVKRRSAKAELEEYRRRFGPLAETQETE